jgi:threonine dehydrogenase-like Zn-dependent dehydrogenase
MKAVVFRGIGDVGLKDVPDPEIKNSSDAIIRITASAICKAVFSCPLCADETV